MGLEGKPYGSLDVKERNPFPSCVRGSLVCVGVPTDLEDFGSPRTYLDGGLLFMSGSETLPSPGR